jgi:hypothetical protein
MNLKDPDSARFGEFYFNTDTKKGCLVVNAKNSMGGYTGDRVASVKRSDAGWEVIDIDDDGDRRFCQEYHADKKD